MVYLGNKCGIAEDFFDLLKVHVDSNGQLSYLGSLQNPGNFCIYGAPSPQAPSSNTGGNSVYLLGNDTTTGFNELILFELQIDTWNLAPVATLYTETPVDHLMAWSTDGSAVILGHGSEFMRVGMPDGVIQQTYSSGAGEGILTLAVIPDDSPSPFIGLAFWQNDTGSLSSSKGSVTVFDFSTFQNVSLPLDVPNGIDLGSGLTAKYSAGCVYLYQGLEANAIYQISPSGYSTSAPVMIGSTKIKSQFGPFIVNDPYLIMVNEGGNANNLSIYTIQCTSSSVLQSQ